MRRRLLAACAPVLFVGSLLGCGAVLGIPGDLVRDDGVDAADELAVVSDTSMPDDHRVAADSSTTPDGDAAITPDGFVAPACDLRKELGTPTLLTSVSTPEQEGSPKLSEDELTIYFDALHAPDTTWELFMATRTALTDSFGPAAKIAGGVNTPDMNEFAPNVSPDELSIFFERQDPVSYVDNFYVATRATKADPWDTAVPISGVNLPEYQGKLEVRGDGSSLFFSKKGTGTTYHLYNAVNTGGNYVITQLSSLNSTIANSEEYGSAVSKNGLVLYFGSTRIGVQAGRRDNDVWVATRAQVTDPFGLPTLVAALNTTFDDEPSWLSNDGCRLYLQSTRTQPDGKNQDLYVATRPK